MLRLYRAELREGWPENNQPLSAYRRERLERLRAEGPRREMLGAEALLLRALRDWDGELPLPPRIAVREGGKPFFPDLPLFFSLSHSAPFVACALADFEIGLDIQARSAARPALLRRCFSASERAFIETAPEPDAAFTRLWCLKESYVKALGEGLARSFASFSFESLDPPRLEGGDPARFRTWEEEGCALALCAPGGQCPEPERIVFVP